LSHAQFAGDLAKQKENMNRIEMEVDQLFKQLTARRGEQCEFPIIGGWFIKGVDRVARYKRLACRALAAREWFAEHGPLDAPPLPLSDLEIEDLKFRDLFSHIISYFAYSLRSQDWDLTRHPNFEDFTRGVLASGYVPKLIPDDEALRRRYPPRFLAGLGPYLVWEQPAVHAETMAAYRRTQAHGRGARAASTSV
jgi:hypothetical protein